MPNYHYHPGKHLETNRNTRPVSVKLPPALEQVVRAQPDKSEFLREAIAAYALQQGLIKREDLPVIYR